MGLSAHKQIVFDTHLGRDITFPLFVHLQVKIEEEPIYSFAKQLSNSCLSLISSSHFPMTILQHLVSFSFQCRLSLAGIISQRSFTACAMYLLWSNPSSNPFRFFYCQVHLHDGRALREEGLIISQSGQYFSIVRVKRPVCRIPFLWSVMLI